MWHNILAERLYLFIVRLIDFSHWWISDNALHILMKIYNITVFYLQIRKSNKSFINPFSFAAICLESSSPFCGDFLVYLHESLEMSCILAMRHDFRNTILRLFLLSCATAKERCTINIFVIHLSHFRILFFIMPYKTTLLCP